MEFLQRCCSCEQYVSAAISTFMSLFDGKNQSISDKERRKMRPVMQKMDKKCLLPA